MVVFGHHFQLGLVDNTWSGLWLKRVVCDANTCNSEQSAGVANQEVQRREKFLGSPRSPFRIKRTPMSAMTVSRFHFEKVETNLSLFWVYKSQTPFYFRGGPLTPTGHPPWASCPWTQMWALPSDFPYRLAHHTFAISLTT